jgi:capsular exopolysaccharide synthesis family protein
MHDEPASPAAESLRVVRAKLERSNGGQPIRRLLIASAGPAGGATTIVANLGVALAESERQVLLVDANLRNPDLHAFFAQADVPGLSSYLAGDASLPAIVAKTHVPRVSLVAAGPPAPNPVELLSSGRMRRLLDDAGEQFDLVVLDAPPILQVADASVLAPLVDGILLVVHAGRVTRESVRQARASLGAVQARILGAVLTRPRSPGRTRASA